MKNSIVTPALWTCTVASAKPGAEIFLKLSRMGAFSGSWWVLDLNSLTTILKNLRWLLTVCSFAFSVCKAEQSFLLKGRGCIYHVCTTAGPPPCLQTCRDLMLIYHSYSFQPWEHTRGSRFPLRSLYSARTMRISLRTNSYPAFYHWPGTHWTTLLSKYSMYFGKKSGYSNLIFISIIEICIVKNIDNFYCDFSIRHSNFAVPTVREDVQIEFNTAWMEHNKNP